MTTGRIGMTRPESLPKEFVVYQGTSDTSPRGRELARDGEEKARINCILSIAKVEEQQRFSQIQKIVTHSLLQKGPPVASENDIIVLTKNERRFRVQGVHNKGELDLTTVYYCEERGDR